METIDAVIDATDGSHQTLNSNFNSLMSAVEQLAELSGVSLRKQMITAEGEVEHTEIPEGTTKH